MPSYCPSCDSYFEGPLENETYDGKLICNNCAEHLHRLCQQCDLLYPVHAEGAYPFLCPDCLSSQTEGDEGDE
ncbi:MAG: hypothetical protein FD169_1833 [Bacillota bacterium]|nr:MAG: hypothetical protein FD169_1833 [Bacillota bacterium]